ncbi:MAG: stage II sporulation protein R [Lachnospiraceae bacterium]|nr:stage II sporulation protein R [Lachnospiraceae bacterium]
MKHITKKRTKSFSPAIFIAALIIGLIITYFFSPDMQDQTKLQRDIADKIIRFHVRANSDSDEDQSLKLKVKDEVVAYLTDAMKNSDSKTDSITYIENHLDDITAVADTTIKNEGYDYKATAYITNEYFPTKSYGDVTIPCGSYDAFRIDIGSSSGQNWWCVLYPPLCFVEGSYGVATDESKMLLKNILDEDEFNYISGSSSKDISFDFKFLSFFK